MWNAEVNVHGIVTEFQREQKEQHHIEMNVSVSFKISHALKLKMPLIHHDPSLQNLVVHECKSQQLLRTIFMQLPLVYLWRTLLIFHKTVL